MSAARELLTVHDEGAYYCAICGIARAETEICQTDRVDPMPSCSVVEEHLAAALADARREGRQSVAVGLKPGLDLAIGQGCTCPRIDNYDLRHTGGSVVSGICPLHGWADPAPIHSRAKLPAERS